MTRTEELRLRAVADAARDALPTLEYAHLQARMTFDPLIRDGHAGGKAAHQRMVKHGIAGTPSVLSIRLAEAIEALRAALVARSQ